MRRVSPASRGRARLCAQLVSVVVVVVMPVRYHQPCVRIEDEFTRAVVAVVIVKVKHAVECAGNGICRDSTNLPEIPVVLDEPEDGGLIGDAMIDIVALREGRNYQEGLAWTITAAGILDNSGNRLGDAAVPGGNE